MLASLYLSLTHILLAMHERGRPSRSPHPQPQRAQAWTKRHRWLQRPRYTTCKDCSMSSHRHKNTKSLQTGLAPSTTYWFTAVAKSTGSTWEVMIRCENCSTPDEESLHKVPKNGSEVRVFKRHPRQVGHCSALRRNDAMVKAQAAAEARLATGTAIHARTSKLVLHASSRIPARLIRRSTRREAFWGLCH